MFLEIFSEDFLKLFVAVILGALIGLERESKKKEAGLKTYSLVSLGSALFTLIALNLIKVYEENLAVGLDPIRVIQAIAIGVGFIGGGIIIYRQFHVEGLTTAAGLWLSSAVGISVGAGFYEIAILASILALIILTFFSYIERWIFKKGTQDLWKKSG